jgi:hypothetical protein
MHKLINVAVLSKGIIRTTIRPKKLPMATPAMMAFGTDEAKQD